MWWSSLFTDMRPSDFFNFSFLPKYGVAFVRGIEYTLLLAVVSVLLAVIPALLLALMRLSKVKPVKWLSGAYIAVFRSTPMLVQLSIIYFGLFYAISLPRVSLFGFVDISRFVPGVVALALNSSAYVAEIFRAGILAVDKGQTEAARSLGLSSWQAMRLVVLPQAIKNVLPALANELVYDKVDAILVDGGVAKQYAEANPDLVIADASAELGEPAPYCVAVQKGDPKGLLPAINAAIAKMNEANMLETFIADADSLADVAVEVSAN